MPRVSEEHRQQQRARILAAARAEFAHNGFQATTMPDVIAAAGMSAGGVYRYFASKDEIVAAVASDAVRALSDVVADLLADPAPGRWPQPLRALLGRVCADGGQLARLAVTVWGEAQRDPGVAAVAGDELGVLRRHLAALVGRAQREGDLPASADPDALAPVVLSLLVGFLLQRSVAVDLDPGDYVAAVGALAPSGWSRPPHRAERAAQSRGRSGTAAVPL